MKFSSHGQYRGISRLGASRNMASLGRSTSNQGATSMTIVVLLICICKNVLCKPTEHEDARQIRIIRYRDVPEATNFLHESMDDQMPMAERCKRYAVLLKIATSSVPYEATVAHLARLPEDVLDKHLQKTDIENISSLFMSAIDKYRVLQLNPAFLELIECLGQFNIPAVKTFLQDPELTLIKDSYRELLDKPDTVLDLDSFDLRAYNPTFRISFRFLFKDHLKDGSSLDEFQPISRAGPASRGTTESNSSDPLQQQQPQKKPDEELPRKTEEEVADDVPEERRQLLLKRRRERARERRRIRNLHDEESHRHRERERLRQRRLRILKPSELRGRERERQKRRRDRKREGITADMKTYKTSMNERMQQAQDNVLRPPPQMDQQTIDLMGQMWRESESGPAVAPAHSKPTIEPSMSNQSQRDISTFCDLLSASDQTFVLDTSLRLQHHQQQLLDAQQQPRAVIPEHRSPVVDRTLPPAKEPQPRQTLFRPQPVRPMTVSPYLTPGGYPQAALSNSSLHSFCSDDRTGFRRLPTSNTAFRRPTYNYVSESASRNGPSPSAGSLISTWRTFTPRILIQSDDFDDLSSTASHLEKTDAVVQAIANHTPRPSPARSTTTRDRFFEANAELASPWYDFDRRFGTKDD